jgi:hypothetical protein
MGKFSATRSSAAQATGDAMAKDIITSTENVLTIRL